MVSPSFPKRNLSLKAGPLVTMHKSSTTLLRDFREVLLMIRIDCKGSLPISSSLTGATFPIDAIFFCCVPQEKKNKVAVRIINTNFISTYFAN
jgi:hypothetical protein